MRIFKLPVRMKSARNDVTVALRTNDSLRKSYIWNDSVISKSYIFSQSLLFPPQKITVYGKKTSKPWLKNVATLYCHLSAIRTTHILHPVRRRFRLNFNFTWGTDAGSPTLSPIPSHWRAIQISTINDLCTRVGILILATPRLIGYKNCRSDTPMQQEGWVLPLPTYIMGAVHHEMGIRSSQLIVSRCRDSV